MAGRLSGDSGVGRSAPFVYRWHCVSRCARVRVRLRAFPNLKPQNRQIIQNGPRCRRTSRRGWPPGGRRPRLIGRRPRLTGRRPRLIEHFGPARRNDGPPMLLGQGGLPQPWAIDVVATTTMGHRCGCLAWPNSIDGPPLRSRPETSGELPGLPEAGLRWKWRNASAWPLAYRPSIHFRHLPKATPNPAKPASWINLRGTGDPPDPPRPGPGLACTGPGQMEPPPRRATPMGHRCGDWSTRQADQHPARTPARQSLGEQGPRPGCPGSRDELARLVGRSRN
jgi:hypothetical protein